MENFEKIKRMPIKQELLGQMINIREKIETEFAKSVGNNWLACFITQISIISMALDRAKRLNEIKNHKEIEQRMDKLVAKIYNLQEQYFGKNLRTIPPRELQDELISKLSAIIEIV